MPDIYTSYCYLGWKNILNVLNQRLEAIDKSCKILVVECYQGVLHEEVREQFRLAFPDALFVDSSEGMLSEQELNAKLQADITDDEIFGYMTRYNIDCYFDECKVCDLRNMISQQRGLLLFMVRERLIFSRKWICWFMQIWLVGKFKCVSVETKLVI